MKSGGQLHKVRIRSRAERVRKKQHEQEKSATGTGSSSAQGRIIEKQRRSRKQEQQSPTGERSRSNGRTQMSQRGNKIGWRSRDGRCRKVEIRKAERLRERAEGEGTNGRVRIRSGTG